MATGPSGPRRCLSRAPILRDRPRLRRVCNRAFPSTSRGFASAGPKRTSRSETQRGKNACAGFASTRSIWSSAAWTLRRPMWTSTRCSPRRPCSSPLWTPARGPRVGRHQGGCGVPLRRTQQDELRRSGGGDHPSTPRCRARNRRRGRRLGRDHEIRGGGGGDRVRARFVFDRARSAVADSVLERHPATALRGNNAPRRTLAAAGAAVPERHSEFRPEVTRPVPGTAADLGFALTRPRPSCPPASASCRTSRGIISPRPGTEPPFGARRWPHRPSPASRSVSDSAGCVVSEPASRSLCRVVTDKVARRAHVRTRRAQHRKRHTEADRGRNQQSSGCV